MAYAPQSPLDRPGTTLGFRRVVLGLISAVIIPVTLAAAFQALSLAGLYDQAFSDVLQTAAALAVAGTLSVLFFFLPLVLWWLRWSTRPLFTCVVAGTLSGPGPLGYWAMFYFTPAVLPPFVMGAVGGFVFWYVAVRGRGE